LTIDKSKTAIVVIDLQKGIASRPTRPHAADLVIANAAKLVNAFRNNQMPVFLVHVSHTPGTALSVISDETFQRPPGQMPPDWAEFVPQLAQVPSDIIITKKQWGAFYGTDLDLQLRRRKLDTIVLCGIATDYGVESTARFAYEYGYQQIFAEDAMASMTDEQHNVAVNFVLKRIGRVRKTDEILAALE
jgi:nicotinamidase-related amidase